MIGTQASWARNVPMASADIHGGGRLRDELKECLHSRVLRARIKWVAVFTGWL